MRLTFSFRNSAEDPIEVKTTFDLPSEANSPDGQVRILEVAELVGRLTEAVLFVTCREASIVNRPVKLTKTTNWPVTTVIHRTVLLFERQVRGQRKMAKLLIVLPVTSPFPEQPIGRQRKKKTYPMVVKHPGKYQPQDDVQRDYINTVSLLGEHCLALLNLDGDVKTSAQEWAFKGFQAYWKDVSAVAKLEKARRKREADRKAEQKRQEREQKRREKQEALGTALPIQTLGHELVTGAGRRPGAIPGVFMNVQMRSQLEIRFAAHLEERKIRWVYEGARLGEEQYLVDFYLPDLGCWVEVKGRFEPRDNIQLPKVAEFLAREHSEHLYVYTQSRAYWFRAKGRITTLTHAEFWARLGT